MNAFPIAQFTLSHPVTLGGFLLRCLLYIVIRGSIKIKIVEIWNIGCSPVFKWNHTCYGQRYSFHFIWKMTSSFAKENSQRSTNCVIEARYVKEIHGPAITERAISPALKYFVSYTLGEKSGFPKMETCWKPQGIVTSVVSP